MKDIETASREAITILQVIHSDVEMIGDACLKTRALLMDAKAHYAKLVDVIPPGQYYRYHDHWRFVTQRLSFVCSLVVFLEAGILIKRETVAEILGINGEAKKDKFHLDIEDFLMGLLQMSSELSRFAVNSVTNGDYSKPLLIARFVADLNAGFRLLNLKNDSLRKKYDALKYDVKKIEEIVYDLRIRGLIQKDSKESLQEDSTMA